MKVSKKWSFVFYIAGAINVIGTLPGIFDPEKGFLDMSGTATTDYHTLWLFQNLWIIVCLMGIGYLIVGRNIAKNHGIIAIGAIGKFIFALMVFAAFLDEKVSVMAFSVGIMDLLWSMVFTAFLLLFHRKS